MASRSREGLFDQEWSRPERSYIIVQFPSWDRDLPMFVPTPLVDLTDGRAENDGDRNRVRASWGLSDAEAMREWLSRFSLGFEGHRELAAERPLTLRRLDSPAIRLSLCAGS